MITEAGIRQASRSQPGRYILYENPNMGDKLIAFEDCDTGYYWFLLPDGVWAWVC